MIRCTFKDSAGELNSARNMDRKFIIQLMDSDPTGASAPYKIRVVDYR